MGRLHGCLQSSSTQKHKTNTTGATIGAGTTYASEAPEFTPGFLSELPLFNLVFCSNLRIIVPLFLVGFVLHDH
jgi:hypothetical protein